MMQINKNNLALSFIVVLTCICFQLCFFENKASAGMAPIISPHPYSPADDSTGVAVSTNLSVTFGSNWVPNGTAGYISIYEAGGTPFEQYYFDTSYNYPANITGEGTPTLTINPSNDLDPGTSYYVTFDPSLVQSDSMTHNTYVGESDPTVWNFTTAAGCYNPPSCIGPCFGTDDIDHLSPPDNAHFMQSYEGLAIVFGSNVTLGTGNLYIREYVGDATVSTIDVTSGAITGWGTNTLTIDIPDNILANNTHYYVNFDIEGWSLPANKDNWDFWTKATPNTFSGSGL